MKKIFFFLLSALALASCKQEVTWDNPSAFMGNSNGTFKITQVEMKKTETVMHLHVTYYPGNWIRFDKHSFLLTPDGQKYAITSGDKTSETETDLTLDSLFWIPQSGTADLALHFDPVPLGTEKMHFLESYAERDFKFWNICDSQSSKEPEWPAEWKNVKYADDETLPAAKIEKGIATLKIKLLDYVPGMNQKVWVYNFNPFGEDSRLEKDFTFADDGTVTAEIPLRLTSMLRLNIAGMLDMPVLLSPGQETSILMKMTANGKPVLAFQGYLAKTNWDVAQESKYINDTPNRTVILDQLANCQTSDERLKCFKEDYEKNIARIQSADITSAAKDLLCMEYEGEYVEWIQWFKTKYINEQARTHRLDVHSHEQLDSLEQVYKDYVVYPDFDKYVYQYLNNPNAPASQKFWDDVQLSNKTLKEQNPLNYDLLQTMQIMTVEALDPKDYIKDEDCLAVIQEYRDAKKRKAEEVKNMAGVFYQTYDKVAPEKIEQTILNKYKGKVVLFDIWATWCGPCRQGHKLMAPMKEQMKDKNVQFVYITSDSSPLDKWQEMIQDIPGDHYYLTYAQYGHILTKYQSQGIPTYVLYTPQGQHVNHWVGFPGVETLQAEIEKLLK